MTEAWLRLAFLGLHPQRVRSLLAEHDGPEAVIAAVAASDGPCPPAAAKCEERLHEAGAVFELAPGTVWGDRFRALPDAPFWLLRRGELQDAPHVAIVGTRRCTEYGRRAARLFGAACAAAGWVVVSGMARGIDGAAQSGALEAGGWTVAVLGCGPDVVYPREHAALRDQILAAEGAVVSEYPPGASPLGWRFPPRNRIISGLSEAVVVVESPASGGSLSTAARALNQGRTVFALPGDVDREASVGCNLLIRDGAVPVLGAADLVEALSLLSSAPGR